ncbi:MAG TPA: hypothetical protein VLC06_26640 [Polyangia bacterium]|jgi:hypothetical protein|nr:hypothetical protein [Polyangia bacterium]
MAMSANEMAISVTTASAARWNARLLGLFGPILILTGLGGFLVPPHLALMSGAAPYDIFHIVCGLFGTALVVARSARGIATFNLAFGLIDLYQAAAGLLGIFPAGLFRYRPGDHVAHLLFGLLLAVVGWKGLRANRFATA